MSIKPPPKFKDLGRPAQVAVVMLCLPIVGVILVVLGLIVKAVGWAWS